MSQKSAQEDQTPPGYQLLEIEDQSPPAATKNAHNVSHPSKISMSLLEPSCVVEPEGEYHYEQSYAKGVSIMLINTLIATVLHVSTKYMLTVSPEMSPLDSVSMMGYSCVPCFYLYAKYKNVNVYLFNFKPKVQLVILVRVGVGLCNNFCLWYGFQYISIGKAILIWSISPLFCAITAAIFLKEKITYQSIGLILFSIVGVYFLTLNKSDDPKVASNETFGYCLMVASAFLYALLFVLLRTMSINGVHAFVSPLYFGTGVLIQNFIIIIFFPGALHFSAYIDKVVNISALLIMMVGCVVGQYTWMTAIQYAPASKLSPIGYSENVLTILSDIVIFNYHFIMTDFLGIAIIILCLVIPLMLKSSE
ncbi:unnamed protein product [Moneuplotes crassus]|uniref:EamA domain-containing protein n=1 Tax=Euplotes crassus TaxID=5936 RepID=A0AAD1UIG0_EUPCR|nr:unnamed protein product [Moneuplotes crassus]